MIPILLAIVSILCGWFYWYLIRPVYKWKRLGIPYLKAYPIVGNFLQSALKLRPLSDSIKNVYDAYPNKKFYGIHFFTIPSILIRDTELIKQITVKDFDHFTDHNDAFFKEGFDPIFDKNLFSLKGVQWHDMRSTLSPAFTGSKMRGMFTMVTECGEQFVQYFKEQIQFKQHEVFEVELKDLFTRFTNDVIATIAFGIKVDSFHFPNNEFYQMGRKASFFSTWRILFLNLMPSLLKLLKFTPLPKSCCNYFRSLVESTITARKQNNIIRPDMLHLLMQAQKGALKYDENNPNDVNDFNSGTKVEGKFKLLTNEDIAAQAFIFFLAGFETVSTAMCFAIYEMAVNPKTQQKLYAEIISTWKQCNGKLTYDILTKMKYLDQIVNETLRKWPPAVFVDRKCTKDYHLTDDDGQVYTLKKGTILTLPIYSLHRDPLLHPKPDVFDPERFNDENKSNIKPFSFAPFGFGPRICIANRFALMEAKTGIFYVIKNFEVITTKKTTIPARLTTKSSNMQLENGFHLGFKLRSQE